MTSTQLTANATSTESQAEKTAKWVAVARSLQPLVESEREQSYLDANISDKVVQAWKDAGLYKAQLPVELGGDGIDNVTLINIMEEVARQDASAGWTFGVAANGTIIAGVLLEAVLGMTILGRISPTQSVVVQGTGPVGLASIALAPLSSPEQIIAIRAP